MVEIFGNTQPQLSLLPFYPRLQRNKTHQLHKIRLDIAPQYAALLPERRFKGFYGGIMCMCRSCICIFYLFQLGKALVWRVGKKIVERNTLTRHSRKGRIIIEHFIIEECQLYVLYSRSLHVYLFEHRCKLHP